MKFTEILVSQGGSQGVSQGGSSSARSFVLARPGVASPLLSALFNCAIIDVLYRYILRRYRTMLS